MLNCSTAAETQNRNGAGLRTGHKADTASCAASAVVGRRAIAVMIEFLAQMNCLGRARLDAHPASFAFVPIDSQQASVPLPDARSFCDGHVRSSLYVPGLDRETRKMVMRT